MRSKLRDYRSIDLTERAMRGMLFWCGSDRTRCRNRSGPSLCSDNLWLCDYDGLLWGDMLLFLLRLNPYVCRVPFASDCEILALRMLRLWWSRNRHGCGGIRGSVLDIALVVPPLHGRHFFGSILFVFLVIVISLLAGGFLSDLAGWLGNSPFLQTTS